MTKNYNIPAKKTDCVSFLLNCCCKILISDGREKRSVALDGGKLFEWVWIWLEIIKMRPFLRKELCSFLPAFAETYLQRPIQETLFHKAPSNIKSFGSEFPFIYMFDSQIPQINNMLAVVFSCLLMSLEIVKRTWNQINNQTQTKDNRIR